MSTTTPKPAPRPCPTPWKQNRYALQDAAIWGAARLNVLRGLRLEPYQCSCGFWHLRDEAKRNLKINAKSAARRARWLQANRSFGAVLRIAEHDEWIW